MDDPATDLCIKCCGLWVVLVFGKKLFPTLLVFNCSESIDLASLQTACSSRETKVTTVVNKPKY